LIVSSATKQIEQLKNSVLAAQQPQAGTGRPLVNPETTAHLHGVVRLPCMPAAPAVLIGAGICLRSLQAGGGVLCKRGGSLQMLSSWLVVTTWLHTHPSAR
jgi:hypothetical protein